MFGSGGRGPDFVIGLKLLAFQVAYGLGLPKNCYAEECCKVLLLQWNGGNLPVYLKKNQNIFSHMLIDTIMEQTNELDAKNLNSRASV